MSRIKAHPRLVVVTNIPSPYRLHEFNVLSQELGYRNTRFEAIFLSPTERGRHWRFMPEHCGFNHQVAPGWTVYLKGYPFLFNPSILRALWEQPPTWLWLGGSWYLPTIVALSWLMSLRGSWLLGWNESTALDHHALPGTIGPPIRRILLRPYHGWIVPGTQAARYAREGLAGKSRPLLTFANTVDETLYRDHVSTLRKDRKALRSKYGLSLGEAVYLWPARLSPVKGILPFLCAIEPLAKRSDFTIMIAGEGPQRSEIEAWLDNHEFRQVRLLGHQDTHSLLELYALSDALLLPSLSESYGFVAVEALWAALPLLLSNRVGALAEVLEVGKNGWVVDPENPDQIRHAFAEMMSTDREALAELGVHSLALAEKNFASRPAVSRFVDDLLAFFPPRS